jgi:hypothetical protein
MPTESRTFIALSDITGVEFECPKCQAKILYPIKKHYEPLPESCPSCGELWFNENSNLLEGQPKVVELVQKTLISLHNMTETPAIRARVRLNVKNLALPDERQDTGKERVIDDKKPADAEKKGIPKSQAS